MNIVLIAREELDDDGSVRLSDARGRHVREVLGAAPGQAVRVGLVNGPLGTGVVSAADGASVELRCTFEGEMPPRPRVDLLLVVPRPKVLRRLWAQIAALGVGRVILTNAARVERHYFDAHVLAREIYMPLLIEGLQQARDTRVPIVTEHRQLKILIEDDLDMLVPDAARVVLHPGAATALAETIQPHAAGRVLLAVGPEGGWNDFELDLLRTHAFQPAGLGPRTLRTDTACVAALAMVHGLLQTRDLA